MAHYYKITIGPRVRRFTSIKEALKYINSEKEPCAQIVTIDRNYNQHSGLVSARKLKEQTQ